MDDKQAKSLLPSIILSQVYHSARDSLARVGTVTLGAVARVYPSNKAVSSQRNIRSLAKRAFIILPTRINYLTYSGI